MTNLDGFLALAESILHRAYGLDATNLDAVARLLDVSGWGDMLAHLDFEVVDTGGGMGMLASALLDGQVRVEITDGEAGLPSSPDDFHVGVYEVDEQELYFVVAERSGVTWRGGWLVESKQVPVIDL
ncbi:hypothetical protein [Deinococcus aluminii]|uniref:ATP-binding protein n=1 Tax=Deinococcus aluminii TaxID=1656885 RepID=A0ABP9XEK8_9DEIO